eukprot:scaffold5144_cov105-Isochrysis_galbana.AAC.5
MHRPGAEERRWPDNGGESRPRGERVSVPGQLWRLASAARGLRCGGGGVSIFQRLAEPASARYGASVVPASAAWRVTRRGPFALVAPRAALCSVVRAAPAYLILY